jgi:hypothetical protein
MKKVNMIMGVLTVFEPFAEFQCRCDRTMRLRPSALPLSRRNPNGTNRRNCHNLSRSNMIVFINTKIKRKVGIEECIPIIGVPSSSFLQAGQIHILLSTVDIVSVIRVQGPADRLFLLFLRELCLCFRVPLELTFLVEPEVTTD